MSEVVSESLSDMVYCLPFQWHILLTCTPPRQSIRYTSRSNSANITGRRYYSYYWEAPFLEPNNSSRNSIMLLLERLLVLLLLLLSYYWERAKFAIINSNN